MSGALESFFRLEPSGSGRDMEERRQEQETPGAWLWRRSCCWVVPVQTQESKRASLECSGNCRTIFLLNSHINPWTRSAVYGRGSRSERNQVPFARPAHGTGLRLMGTLAFLCFPPDQARKLRTAHKNIEVKTN